MKVGQKVLFKRFSVFQTNSDKPKEYVEMWGYMDEKKEWIGFEMLLNRPFVEIAAKYTDFDRLEYRYKDFKEELESEAETATTKEEITMYYREIMEQ